MSFVSTYNTVTVTTAATQIVAANPERKGFILVNTSAGTVYLGMDSSVTTTNGMPVLQNASFSTSDIAGVWKGAIYGIVGSATSDIRYWEYGP